MFNSANQQIVSSHRMPQKKIVIIDSHSIYRMGLIIALKPHLPHVEFIEAVNIEDALDSCQSADLVLFNIEQNGTYDLALIAKIKTVWPKCKIIASSEESLEDFTEIAQVVGADHFFSKTFFSSQIISIIISALDNTRQKYADIPSLSPRQLQTLELMNRGFTNKIIAQKLGISENTVRWHVKWILTRLEASSRTEAIFNARNLGLLA